MRQLEFKGCSDVLWHTCCALSVLPRNGKFLVNQLDCVLFCYARMLCNFLFFLHDGKILVEAGGLLSLWQVNFELVKLFLEMRLEIVVVRTHGV